MPQLVRLYIRQSLIGFGIAAAFVAGLLWLNVANLGHLVLNSDVGIVATVMLVMFNGLVFAGVQFAMTIMRMQENEDEDGPGGNLPVMLAEPVPVPVAASARPRPQR